MGTDYEGLAREMMEWFSIAEHYSVVHFAIEQGMSKEELFRVCGEDSRTQKVLDYAISVQEYKVMEGAMNGQLDRNVALKMLETYAGWKGEVNILQRNEYKQFMNEAREKAEGILGGRVVEVERVGGGDSLIEGCSAGGSAGADEVEDSGEGRGTDGE